MSLSSKILDRIDGLLSKAASTEYPDEAEALMAKAQEMMAKYAIDDAMLAAAGKKAKAEIVSESVVIEAPYASAKAVIFNEIAMVNDCRVVMVTNRGKAILTVVGYEEDISTTRTLYTALNAHAVRVMLKDQPEWENTRRFRQAFLVHFAGRIGERLKEARKAAEADAESESGSGVAIVLADKTRQVEADFRERFPVIRTRKVSASSHAGASSGRRAADSASLGQRGIRGAGRALTA